MISSVIAHLSLSESNRARLLADLAGRVCFEFGELIDDRKLPITIDVGGAEEMEAETQWLQSHCGVEFVDVVFVHFEDDLATGINEQQDEKTE